MVVAKWIFRYSHFKELVKNQKESIKYDYTITQTYSKDNNYKNIVTSYNLSCYNFAESSNKTIQEKINLWPKWKQGYFNSLLKVLKTQEQSKEYWTKTKWCMKYYNLEPIQDTKSVTNPPL
ncbi:uncharacterized protein LOC132953842 [Metopolophium dirhodum]|uniref:uncharacterized protein LOC132953842 n=1 Tax=Metopolophium dirhodum TaxID=44670 RepID=UPI0029901080|nr:uncharacterized protein LOC132953842 [Metopolophium dirhodum]